MTDASVLSTRTLNRTLLQRQFLAARTSRPVLDVVEHLVALQEQEPNWPYVGLWTRLADFRHDDLMALLRDGRVVRSTALRSTQHLTSSNDFRWLRPVVQPVLDRTAWAQYFAAQTAGLDIAELTDAGRELMAGQTLPRRKLALSLAERFPGRDGRVLAGGCGAADTDGARPGHWRLGQPPQHRHHPRGALDRPTDGSATSRDDDPPLPGGVRPGRRHGHPDMVGADPRESCGGHQRR